MLVLQDCIEKLSAFKKRCKSKVDGSRLMVWALTRLSNTGVWRYLR